MRRDQRTLRNRRRTFAPWANSRGTPETSSRYLAIRKFDNVVPIWWNVVTNSPAFFK
jgi:hypothetical protein